MIDLSYKTAVVIVDAQRSMFEGESAVHDSAAMLAKIKRVEAFAQNHGLLTVYLQHNGKPGSPEEPGTDTWKLHPELGIFGPVIEKKEYEAFESTNLGTLLAKNQIKQVVLCGMQSDFCINANTLASLKGGFRTILIADAHSTCDDGDKSAKSIIDETNGKLKPLVELMTTDELTSVLA